ncbi:nucleotidyltransferase family protein [candidate division KSB1 bacterium]|nr:nucleotidyltransferase family protein [candidate division KSB1 bacterium]
MIAGIILAAGESRRMGKLKPVLKIGGKTFLQYIEAQLTAAGIHPIVVVLGYKPDLIRHQSGIKAKFVINDHYQHGQFSSLQTGVKALPSSCRAVIVCLGDQPHIRAEWIKELTTAFTNTNSDIIIPQYGGQSGHPVLYSSRVLEKILQMKPTQTARDLRDIFTDSTLRINLASEGILFDADTPRDLHKIQSRFMPPDNFS